VADFNPYLTHMVPWAHKSLPPNGISIGSVVLAQYISVTNTQTTLRMLSVAIGRIYAMHVMRRNNVL